jgi:hypothetical protein
MPPKINDDYTWFSLGIIRSPIHRWGVVARQTIPKNKYVIEYTGQLLNRRQNKVVWTDGRRYCFTYHLNKYWILDGAVRGSGAERVNHSCDPNLVAEIQGKRVYFWALRQIKKGEELTVDYRFEPSNTPIPCHCGSKKCRGTINVPQDWIRDPFRAGLAPKNEVFVEDSQCSATFHLGSFHHTTAVSDKFLRRHPLFHPVASSATRNAVP